MLNSSILWPGAGLQYIEGSTVTAPPGLEVGDAKITSQVLDGKWAGMEWSWTRPVFLTPPEISAPILCKSDMVSEQFIRGESGTVWVGIVDARPVDNIGIKLIAGPNTERMLPSVFFEEMIPPPEWNSQHSHHI